MHWEIGLTFQCSGLMLRVPDEIGATPPFVLGSLYRFSALMESATLWKVDATEAALRAEAGLDRFP